MKSIFALAMCAVLAVACSNNEQITLYGHNEIKIVITGSEAVFEKKGSDPVNYRVERPNAPLGKSLLLFEKKSDAVRRKLAIDPQSGGSTYICWGCIDGDAGIVLQTTPY
jgi:hypothetical protein